ncbi:hypothetical protein Taro_054286 [Colocasia esculenta]|uniref:Uncharacterized protein n=1 Tax=Colocasia esculenta TaxID=4460 RepID=A0A843XNF6_COLES|nr:hypothetical protein [Colocasia esculenta]
MRPPVLTGSSLFHLRWWLLRALFHFGSSSSTSTSPSPPPLRPLLLHLFFSFPRPPCWRARAFLLKIRVLFPVCRAFNLLLLLPLEAAWIGGSVSSVRQRRWPASSMAAFTLLLLLPLLRLAAGAAGTPSPSSGPHITDLNVLLPPRMTNPVQHRLIGTGGCFSWTWDHHDILHVEPEFNGTGRCSTSARIVSIAPYSGRKETAVYAADLGSGTVIRCEVFIDNISRIQIFHHSVKLDLDGFATLKVRAFDSEENVFSSLVGLQFMWQLMPESPEGDHSVHHLAHVPLKETPLTDCGGFCGDLDTQIKLEDDGMGSDLYVIKGVEIGHEVVIAQLLEPRFEHVMDKIVLTVAEAMSLYPPSPIFVVIGSLIQYRLRIIRRNNPQAVDLPSPFHRWSVSNSTVAQVDSLMGLARALKLGTTIITVEDTRVVGHTQMSTMHSNMLTLESDNSKIWDIFTLSDDMAAKYGWQNSRTFKPLSQGQGYLTASLFHHRGDPEITEVLKGMQQVIVCEKVRVGLEDTMEYPQIIHLPWAPGVHQEVELKAMGGCCESPASDGVGIT